MTEKPKPKISVCNPGYALLYALLRAYLFFLPFSLSTVINAVKLRLTKIQEDKVTKLKHSRLYFSAHKSS